MKLLLCYTIYIVLKILTIYEVKIICFDIYPLSYVSGSKNELMKLHVISALFKEGLQSVNDLHIYIHMHIYVFLHMCFIYLIYLCMLSHYYLPISQIVPVTGYLTTYLFLCIPPIIVFKTAVNACKMYSNAPLQTKH